MIFWRILLVFFLTPLRRKILKKNPPIKSSKKSTYKFTLKILNADVASGRVGGTGPRWTGGVGGRVGGRACGTGGRAAGRVVGASGQAQHGLIFSGRSGQDHIGTFR